MSHLFRITTTLALGVFSLVCGTALAHHAEELELYPDDAGATCDNNALQIRVTVQNVSHQGIMKLELYNSEKGFLMKKGRLRSYRVPAEDAPQKICINVAEPGTYAVTGYHDKDGNRKLKQKWNFTPKEPYGVSNNPRKKKRPKFDEAAFEVGMSGQDIELILVDLQAD